MLDYVASWFWKGTQYIADSHASMALVSTSSIVQGIQVSTLFPKIFELDVGIDFAYQSFPWSNNAKYNAGVHVVIIGLSAKQSRHKNRKIFKLIKKEWHTEIVSNISPYLIAGNDIAITARSYPLTDISPAVDGSNYTKSEALMMTTDQKNTILSIEPELNKWIKPLLGSKEFLQGVERWCFWLVDATEEDINQSKILSETIEQVKIDRQNSKDKPTREKAILIPHLFPVIRQPKQGNYLLIPRVTSERRTYIPMGFFDYNVITTNANIIVPSATLYDFGLLNSIAHNDWMRLVAGRLESRYRYSATIVYNTFPFPDTNEKQRQKVENLAEEILLARASNAGMTLAKLYDPDKMPEDLKQAHSTLDDAVDKLYRPQGFANTEERLAHLLARYEQLIELEQQSKGKKKAK